MKNLLKTLTLGIVIMTATLHASPFATAYWTGKMRNVTTVTGRYGVSCEYQYAGQKFWQTFDGAICPTQIQVR